MKLNNKFALGCLVQWYEIELIEEYIQSVKNTLNLVDNKENVIVHFTLVVNQDLEKLSNEITMSDIVDRFVKLVDSISLYTDYDITNRLYTIADYRREFNENYCDEVDVLMWGESDSLLPKQTFEILDNMHTSVKEKTPKYVSFFGTCKMWDDSWKVIEHTDFTDKPFIDGDEENWWSLRYNMSIDEMNEINDKVESLDVHVTHQYKFNGCGLVISSDLIKSGVNIPKSVFFIHEDTAFMLQLQKLFGGQVPQYIIKNILLVHNRKHKKKRTYVLGEEKIKAGDIGAARLEHDWYRKASDMCHHNTYNMFNQSKVYSWKDVFDE